MYRAYHAIRGLTRSDGKSTNATYGFITMLRKLLADHQPQYIAASFDLRGATFRSQIAADYKATRSPMPGDLAEQVPWVHEACEALGVPIFTMEGFEADDVIGTLAAKAGAHGFQAAIVTGDKDFFQLVGDGIRVYNPRDEGTWYDAEGVLQKFGVAPVAGLRRARLDGRLDRQRQGRARHRRKGRARVDRDLWFARIAAATRRRDQAEEIPRRPARLRRPGAAEPRAGDDRHHGRRALRDRTLQVQGRRSRALLCAVLEDGVPHAGAGVRADRVVGQQRLRGDRIRRKSSPPWWRN